MYSKKTARPRIEPQGTPASSGTLAKTNTQRLLPPLEHYLLPRYSYQCIINKFSHLKKKVSFILKIFRFFLLLMNLETL